MSVDRGLSALCGKGALQESQSQRMSAINRLFLAKSYLPASCMFRTIFVFQPTLLYVYETRRVSQPNRSRPPTGGLGHHLTQQLPLHDILHAYNLSNGNTVGDLAGMDKSLLRRISHARNQSHALPVNITWSSFCFASVRRSKEQSINSAGKRAAHATTHYPRAGNI